MIYDTLVSYDAVSGGVWLTHFINQHVGYCGIKADRRQFDWWCPAVEWRVNRPFPSSSAKGRCAFRMVPIHNIVNHRFRKDGPSRRLPGAHRAGRGPRGARGARRVHRAEGGSRGVAQGHERRGSGRR